MRVCDYMLTHIMTSTTPKQRSVLWEITDTADIIFVVAAEIFEGDDH